MDRQANGPGAVCSAGDQSVDEQLVAVTGSDVQRGVSVLVHAVDLPTWHEEFQSRLHKNRPYGEKTQAQDETHRSE